MAKSPFQDIVPPEKKSIKRIPVPPTRNVERVPDRIEQSEFFRQPPQQIPIRTTPSRTRPEPRYESRPQQRPDREELEEEFAEKPIPRSERLIPEDSYQPRTSQPPRLRRTYEEEPEEEETRPPRYSRPVFKVDRRRRKFPWLVLTILLLALIAIGATFFFMSQKAGAKVVITPRTQQISVDSTFTATKSSTTTPTALQFQTLTISKDGKMEVAASGSEQADVKASGTIIIYNEYSAAPQKLIANTRFETPEGLIFRINDAVTVPGKSGTTPGQVEAIVTADKTGADYNVGLKDFTIPGFKGDAKFDKIYARTKVSIAGGFSGTRPKVDPSDVTASQTKIKDELKAALVAQAQNAIPADYIMPTNAYFVEYENLPQTQSNSGGAQISVRATLHGLIFMRSQLAAQLSQKANGTVDQSQTDILGIANLLFNSKSASSSTNIWDKASLSFTLTGTTTLVSSVDTGVIQKELTDKPRKNLNAILAGYPSVAKADLTMWPFWRTVFPSNSSEIQVIVSKPTLSQ